ncbi:hypothetical protein Poly30_43430 [Planctomycetes bacterium Poly30]|uniref:Uncharacterized protein n=1 Tax=Saltatorellus ferox TaxID=2528018 RepID=A0A518EXH7_9BACT|nr:hypothetical protein Poly30_43430 [Planctomycetes bacterium Poly30]
MLLLLATLCGPVAPHFTQGPESPSVLPKETASLLAPSVSATTDEPTWLIRAFDEEHGTPIAGVRVWASYRLGSFMGSLGRFDHVLGSAVTDRYGEARVPLTKILELNPAEMAGVDLLAKIFKPGYQLADQSSGYYALFECLDALDELELTGRDVEMVPGRTIVGRVVDQQGRAVAGATLLAGRWEEESKEWVDRLDGTSDSLESGPGGYFFFDLGDRDQLTLAACHPSVGRGLLVLSGARLERHLSEVVVLALDPPEDWQTVKLVPAGKASPCSVPFSAFVRGTPDVPHYWGFDRFTGTDGVLQLPTWSDTQWVIAPSRPAASSDDSMEWIELDETFTNPIVLTHPIVNLSVKSTDGRPVRDCSVEVSAVDKSEAESEQTLAPSEDSPPWSQGWLFEGDIGDGRWCVPVVGPGHYRIRVTSRGADYEVWADQQIIEVKDGETHPVVHIVLQQAPSSSQNVDVTFLNASGEPVPHWSMNVGLEPPRDRLIQMSDTGHRLAQGYELEFSRPRWPRNLCDVTAHGLDGGFDLPASARIDVGQEGTQKLVLESPGIGGRLRAAPRSPTEDHDGAYRTLVLTRDSTTDLTFFGRWKQGVIRWSHDSRVEPRSATLLLPRGVWRYRLLDAEFDTRDEGTVQVIEQTTRAFGLRW